VLRPSSSKCARSSEGTSSSEGTGLSKVTIGSEPAAEPAAAPTTAPLLRLEKRSPSTFAGWQARFFDLDTHSFTYYADEERRTFKGAVPLELVTKISVEQDIMSLHIPGRSFELRLPSDAPAAVLVDLKAKLLSAVSAAKMNSGDDDAQSHASKLPAQYWRKLPEQHRVGSTQPDAYGLERDAATSRVGQRSRQAHPGYPQRAKVTGRDASWEVMYSGYAPPVFSTPSDIDSITPDGSWAGPLVKDDVVSGHYRNPLGRTGLAGRGGLRRRGPNQEARLMLTRTDATGATLVAVVRGRQGDEWMLPGGFLPSTPGDDAPPLKTFEQTFRLQLASNPTTSEKELISRLFADHASAAQHTAASTAAAADSMADSTADSTVKAPLPSWLVYLGVTDSSANTDNAWVETAVAHFAMGNAEPFDFSPGSTIRDAKWIKIPQMGLSSEDRVASFWDDVRPLHRQWVRAALTHRPA